MFNITNHDMRQIVENWKDIIQCDYTGVRTRRSDNSLTHHFVSFVTLVLFSLKKSLQRHMSQAVIPSFLFICCNDTGLNFDVTCLPFSVYKTKTSPVASHFVWSIPYSFRKNSLMSTSRCGELSEFCPLKQGSFAFCLVDCVEAALIQRTYCTMLCFSTSEMFVFLSSGI